MVNLKATQILTSLYALNKRFFENQEIEKRGLSVSCLNSCTWAKKKDLSISADQEQFYLVRFFFCYMHFQKHNLQFILINAYIYLKTLI